ncbi:MAG: hypothetical protein F6K58_18015 [Symploca sp. SIO2E9]|nr:hypothetical protein [Symploca sp. SIO2E9]
MDFRKHLEEQIQEDYKHLKKYEDELRYAITLDFKLHYNRQIEEIRQRISDREAELESLNNPHSITKPKPRDFTPECKVIKPLLPKSPIRAKDPDPPSIKPAKADEKPRASYIQLCKLLEAGKWKEADLETARVILEVAERQKDDWLRVRDLENFSCPDLASLFTKTRICNSAHPG